MLRHVLWLWLWRRHATYENSIVPTTYLMGDSKLKTLSVTQNAGNTRGCSAGFKVGTDPHTFIPVRGASTRIFAINFHSLLVSVVPPTL